MSSSRPSLLAVSPLAIWPVDNGYALRVASILRELSATWDVTLVSPAGDGPVEHGSIEIVRHVPVALSGSGLSYPWRFDPAPLRAAIDQAVAESSPSRALVWRGAEAAWFDSAGLPAAVLDLIDCTPLDLWRSLKTTKDWRARYRKLREIPIAARYARRAVRSFGAVVCAGELDATWLRALGRLPSVHVVSNGVAEAAVEDRWPPCATPRLGFIGTLDFEPNVDAALFLARQIWPLVRAAIPEAELVIAGRKPLPVVQALGDLPGVEVAGDVPDVNAVLAGCWVSIAPMRSGVGVKNKVLEAWACARPVVLTPLAVNGLVLPPSHAGLVHATAEGMADAVVRLCRDPGRAQALGADAHRHVRQHYTWAASAAGVDELLRAVVPRVAAP